MIDLLKQAAVHRMVPYSVKRAYETGSLHKIAANMARSNGVAVTGDLDIHSALRALGSRIYLKNAEWKMIHTGLDALKGL